MALQRFLIVLMLTKILGCVGLSELYTDPAAPIRLSDRNSNIMPDGVQRGVQARLTKSGLDYLAKIEVMHFEEELQNLKIPDEKGGGEHFTYSATNILIKKAKVESQTMETIPGMMA